MLQVERHGDFEEAIRAVLSGFQSGLRTAITGIVESYNSSNGTVRVKPAIQFRVQNPDGTVQFQDLKLLVDVPVVFMGGGNFVATFPIQAGDEALVIVSDRCIDSWWQSGQVSIPARARMHSPSDGFALIGPRSLARLIPNVSTTTAQFRSFDGTTYFEIAANGVANIVAPGGLNIAGNVTVNGTVTATEEVTAQSETTPIPLSSHVHFGTSIPPSIATGGPTT